MIKPCFAQDIPKVLNIKKHAVPLVYVQSIMSYRTNEDNIYDVGTIMMAKDAPTVKLKIEGYYQRIYYCSIVGVDGAKQKAYFERELAAPVR
jgi:hypothetical protein